MTVSSVARPPRRCPGATRARRRSSGSHAPRPDQQRGGPPPERLVRQVPGRAVAHELLRTAAAAEPVVLARYDTAREHRARRLHDLTHDH